MKPYRAIRISRITIQTLATLIITASVVTGSACFLSRIQIIPAIAACATLWLAIWFTLTLVFGRVYCSTVCPTGALTDFIARLSHSKRFHYRFVPVSNRLRLTIVVAVVACAVCGVGVVVALLDPYSAFVRIVTAISRPLVIGTAGLAVAALTLFFIILLAAKSGRKLCNTVCPVGSVLGAVSRFSIFHTDINPDLCVNCGRCEDHCSSQCINLRDHTVDTTRCVVCFKCMDVCPNDAITYRRGRHHLTMPMMQRIVTDTGVSAVTKAEPDTTVKTIDRRKFIVTGLAALAATATGATSEDKADYVAGSKKIVPLNHVTPPGVFSREDFLHRCTSCGACVSACPSGVLKLSATQYGGIRHALAPVMDFDRAFCRYDCVKCSEVCPTKALRPLTVTEKHSAVIGKARVEAGNCLFYAKGEPCGICARRCPRQAIHIATDSDGRHVPVVAFDDCIGCGQCAYVCPALPYKAIIIEGK